MVIAERAYGTDWVISSGLAPGDKVITQGLANLKNGAAIKPVPAGAPQRLTPGKPGDKAARGGRSGQSGG